MEHTSKCIRTTGAFATDPHCPRCQLNATAPDLLEACKFLLEECRGHDVKGGADEDKFIAAEAAIAKAESEV